MTEESIALSEPLFWFQFGSFTNLWLSGGGLWFVSFMSLLGSWADLGKIFAWLCQKYKWVNKNAEGIFLKSRLRTTTLSTSFAWSMQAQSSQDPGKEAVSTVRVSAKLQGRVCGYREGWIIETNNPVWHICWGK